MKKTMVLSFLIIFALYMGSSMLLSDSASGDYKVIKKAMKKSKKSSDCQWFKIEITNNKTGKTSVKVKLPLNLLESLSEHVSDNINLGKKASGLKFKEIIEILKTYKGESIIEVEDEDETVKIWIE